MTTISLASSQRLDSDKLLRLKYYKDLKKKGKISSDSWLAPPETYYINANLFMVIQPSIEYEKPIKAKSWVTILSVWNTMIGSSIVSIPYSTSKAGVVPTIFINLIYFLICYYTAVTICKTGLEDNDFSDTIEKYLGKTFGKTGKYLQVVFSILLNVGALYIYFLIINQNMYPIMAYVLNKCGMTVLGDDMTPSFDRFSIIYCSMILAIVLFPVINMKEITFLIRISSKGIFFVSFLILFVYYTGIKSMFNTTFDHSYIYNKGISPSHISLFGPDPSILAGALSLGYYTHNFIIPVMKNNENQRNNRRDLFLGYFLVFLTYSSLGIAGYYGFNGSDFYNHYSKKTDNLFQQNWFQFFDPNDLIMLFFRLLSLIQLCSVFPIIVYITRIQIFGTFWNNNYPSFLHVTIFNILTVISAIFVIKFCSNSLSKLMGFIGAGTGFFLIYLTPLVVNMVYFNIKHPEDKNEFEVSLSAGADEYERNNSSDINDETCIVNEPLRDKIGVSQKPYSKLRNIAFVILNIMLMLFGLFTLIIQFVNINYFGIEFRDS